MKLSQRSNSTHPRLLFVAVAWLSLSANAGTQQEPGIVPLFDGQTLRGWKEIHRRPGSFYSVTNGVIVAPSDTANNLVTERSFADFILRLDFKLTPGANNGVGIRVPLDKTNATGYANEIQILDDLDPKYANLEPGQYCGSFYKILPARRGALNKVGDWNHYEITAIGPRIKVVLNGKVVVDGSIDNITNKAVIKEHPAMFRKEGHISLLGHWSHVEFKDIFIKELPASESLRALSAPVK